MFDDINRLEALGNIIDNAAFSILHTVGLEIFRINQERSNYVRILNYEWDVSNRSNRGAGTRQSGIGTDDRGDGQ